MAQPAEVRLISWNIHRGRGADGRIDPARILEVLRCEVWRPEAEALFLQEADAEAAPHGGVLDLEAVAETTGLRHLQGARRLRSTDQSHGFCGVVGFLSPAWRVEAVRLVDLPGLCPRGALVVDAERAGHPVRFCATHLSLSQPLRVVQMRTLGQHFRRFDSRQTILLGDLNEWRPWGGLALSRWALMAPFHGPARPTFPVGRPLFPLDRVLTDAPGAACQITVLDGPGIRSASDHRPILGTVSLTP